MQSCKLRSSCFCEIAALCVSCITYDHLYMYITMYGNHRNFRPIDFSSYANLKLILQTTLRHLSFSSFILTSSNI